MGYRELYQESNEQAAERFELVMERIAQIAEQTDVPEVYDDYFKKTAAFLLQLKEIVTEKENASTETKTMEALEQENKALYEDLFAENYATGYGNPAYAVEKLGEEYGQILSFLYAECRKHIKDAYCAKKMNVTIAAELFVEVYNFFEDAELVDENSFMELGSLVTARSTDFNLANTDTPSDGVITGYGLIDGSLVYVYSQNASVLNGTIGEMHAKKIANVYDMAMKMGAPVIGFIDCAGMRLQESVDALDGFGRIYAKEIEASGVIPQISAVFGNCGGGLAVVPALSDFAFMEESKAKMFINSPNAIEGNRIEKCDTSAAKFQSEETGCVDYAGTEDEILAQIRELVSMLPLNNEGDVYTEECEDDLNRACASMDVMKGDARYLLSEISDGHAFFETKADYAKNMVTGFIKLNGMTVGAVANCTEIHDEEGKTAETFEAALTVKGCEKASEFIRFCDAFEIPVLSITNVTGFKACMCAEKGLAKALAHMTSAFASATCPKVNLIAGDAFGSAYVTMNSKSIGADLVYAWPETKIGMMDAELAAKIMYADASADVLAEKAKEYEKLQSNVVTAARRGYVDLIIEPADTRKYLVAAFEMLYTKCVCTPDKKHGTK